MLALLHGVVSFQLATSSGLLARPSCVASSLGAVRMEFGDNFYLGHTSGPEGAELPDGVTEVALLSPLGINFEEKDGRGGYPGGLRVIALVPGGAAERSGKVKVGDDLVAVTGIKMIGAKYERILFDARRWDFDTVVEAI